MALDHAHALAAGLYGILLGLGFTTFVLSFGVWALAGISVALGDPWLGFLIGAAFGIGRAIPVIAVAPIVDSPLGTRCIELMAERPALYRAFRLGDAATLCLLAAALTATATATAARTRCRTAPTPRRRQGARLPETGRSGVVRLEGHTYRLPGRDPAIGGNYVAVISGGDEIRILDRFTRQAGRLGVGAGAQAIAICPQWLTYMAIRRGRYRLRARRINRPGSAQATRRGSPRFRAPAKSGIRASTAGAVFYAVSRRHRNSIKRLNLRTRERGARCFAPVGQLLNPAAPGGTCSTSA